MKTYGNEGAFIVGEYETVILVDSADLETRLKKSFGLTKREYFAAKAMQGISSTFPANEKFIPEVVRGITREAVILADALIEELNKESNE